MLQKLFRSPPGEFVHSRQGCNAFTEGCSMGGLDPSELLRSRGSWPNQTHLKTHSLIYHGESRIHICAWSCITAK